MTATFQVRGLKKHYFLFRQVRVVIDYTLPDMQGPTVAEQILKWHSACPVVFVSSAYTDKHFQEAKKLGVKQCIEKGDTGENLSWMAALLASL